MSAEKLEQQSIKMAKRLKSLRVDANISQETAAKCTDVCLRTYKRYECDTKYCTDYGCNLGMSIRNLFGLAELYNCSVDYILGLSDEKRYPNANAKK